MTCALLSPSITPEESVEVAQRRQRVRDGIDQALAEFPPEDRTLFKLHRLEEMPLTEAAKIVGMHKEKARVRYEKAMIAVGCFFSRQAEAA